MPEGIIRDPKVNPREKSFGIVYLPDFGGNFKYFKTKSNKKTRGFLPGSVVYIELKSDPEYYDDTMWIDGIPVKGQIENNPETFSNITDGQNAPIISIFYNKITGATGDDATEIIADIVESSGIQSDVPAT